MTQVRTRFAPSPTGKLHIGGFRTAFFAWLYARHFNGSFLLRIEDTDQERKVDGAIAYILEGFKWFGLDIDEGPSRAELEIIGEHPEGYEDLGGEFGPYIQTLRRERYQEVADQLVASGHAFRCDCTPEMLEADRQEQQARKETPGYSGRCRTRNVSKDTKHVVRFLMPENPDVTLQDAIRGEIHWDSVPLRDPVLLKSDGLPTYHLAVVVDDHYMQISHVMRSQEWLPSAPLHVLLYQALGWQQPIFCHFPFVMGEDGKKLSKRHGATSWSNFKDEGYLPEALLNYVALVGWSPGEGEEQEIFSKDELVQRFSLEQVSASDGIFDYKKLLWMNGAYIRKLSTAEFVQRARPFLEKAGIELSAEFVELLGPALQERCKLLSDAPGFVGYFSDAELQHNLSDLPDKGIEIGQLRDALAAAKTRLETHPEWNAAALEQGMKELASELGIKPGHLLVSLRVAVTGGKTQLPLFESIQVLGRECVCSRIASILTKMQ